MCHWLCRLFYHNKIGLATCQIGLSSLQSHFSVTRCLNISFMLFVSPVVLYVIRSPFCISRSIRFSPVECNHFFLFQLKSVRRIFGKVASCCSHSCIPLSSLPHHSSHNSTSRGYFGRTVLEAIVIFRKMRKKPSGVLFIKVRQWFYFY